MNVTAKNRSPSAAEAEDKPIFKDAALEAAFRVNGFVVVDLLTADKAERLKQELGVYQSTNSASRNPLDRIACTYFDPDNRQAASDLVNARLGAELSRFIDGYRPVLGTSMVKYGNAGSTITHRHYPITSQLTDVVLGTWVALDPCSPGNGSIAMVPRSHSISWHIDAPLAEPYFNRFIERIEQSYFQDFTLAPGQAVIFDNSIVHGARANSSAQDRHAAVAFLIPKNAVSAAYLIDQPDDALFQVVAADHEFIHCEMSQGQLPEVKTRHVLKTLENRNSVLTEAEFAWLLESGLKIQQGVDPVAMCRRALAPPASKARMRGNLVNNVTRRLSRLFQP